MTTPDPSLFDALGELRAGQMKIRAFLRARGADAELLEEAGHAIQFLGAWQDTEDPRRPGRKLTEADYREFLRKDLADCRNRIMDLERQLSAVSPTKE